MNNVGLVSEVKTLGTVLSPNGKPYIGMFYFDKQNIKMMMTLKKRNMQITNCNNIKKHDHLVE